MKAIASNFGMAAETLRNWARQAERDRGLQPGPNEREAGRVKELERENKELRGANEIPKATSVLSTQDQATSAPLGWSDAPRSRRVQ
jgi:transposase